MTIAGQQHTLCQRPPEGTLIWYDRDAPNPDKPIVEHTCATCGEGFARRPAMRATYIQGGLLCAPQTVSVDNDCNVRIFERDPSEGDLSRMYVMEALGVCVNIYVRNDDGSTYVHVENVAIPDTRMPLLVEANNSGEHVYDNRTGAQPGTAVFNLHCAACEHYCCSRGNFCTHCNRIMDGRWVFPLWPDKERTRMPDAYGWLITRDYMHEVQHPNCPDGGTCVDNAAGLEGPSERMTDDIRDRLHRGEGLPFRLYDHSDDGGDGDGFLLREGLLIVPDGHETGPALLAPVDATRAATTIVYQDQEGQWSPMQA
ncbi:hypothetical protein ACQEVF_56660 [Nonomuraea polychroma]|uniref:hypothetical protein n=1 Tax=Nonomuraea polychroma TaxID=46176 RepID=UPI003D89D008